MAKGSAKANRIVDQICKTIERYCRFEGRKPNRYLVMPDVFDTKTMKHEGTIFGKMVAYVDRELNADDAAKQGKRRGLSDIPLSELGARKKPRPKPVCKECGGTGKKVTYSGDPYQSWESEPCFRCSVGDTAKQSKGKPRRKAVRRAST